jgi:6-phosphogluconolactonase (cycloisomerase 2 family)
MMMTRRVLNMALAGSVAAAAAGCSTIGGRSNAGGRTVLYNAIDDKMTQYDVDVEAATLTQRATVTLPSTVQYAWFHPSHRFVYASTSDAPGGSPASAGKVHRLCALRVGADGALTPHGEPQVLTQRPIHNSIDATGGYALTCYSALASLTVHRINSDGTLGSLVAQPAGLDTGNFPHQVRATPGNRSVVLVTRGVSATDSKPEDPGALKIYGFRDGQMSPLANVVVGGRGGLGYGPRHLDFHPSKPWVYLSVERQGQLHMHRMEGDSFAAAPDFIKRSTDAEDRGDPRQLPSAIHVHPKGHVVYISNRADGTTAFNGQLVFRGGENSICVFAIDPSTGEPRLIQSVDVRGFYPRTFSIDPSGRLMVAATGINMLVREGNEVRRVAGGLSLLRIADDGRLTFVRKYDVEIVNPAQQLWVGMTTMPG